MPEVSKISFSYRDDPVVPDFDGSRALFVFDGVCVLCSGGAGWLIRWDRKAQVNLTPAQGELGQALYAHYGMEIDESYLLIANGRAFTASRGYLELCRILGGGWRILLVFALFPESLRDRVYTFVARNRYRWFGKAGYCELLTAEQRQRLVRIR